MNIQTYNFILEFIDAMANRGAIKGDELYHVGALRNIIQEELEKLSQEPEEAVMQDDK